MPINVEQTISKDFKLEVKQGNITGWTTSDKFGFNSDIDTGTYPEDIWSVGGVYAGWLSSEEEFEILSSSTEDTAAGVGAQKVVISNLLDANFDAQEDVEITLNGTTAVSLGATEYKRCSRAYVKDVGSSAANVGTITIRGASTSTTVASIPAGKGQTQMALYTVPNGKTLFVDRLNINMSRSTGAAGSAFIDVFARSQGESWRSIINAQITDSHGYQLDQEYLEFAAKTEIRITVTEVSDNNTAVDGRWSGYLKDD